MTRPPHQPLRLLPLLACLPALVAGPAAATPPTEEAQAGRVAELKQMQVRFMMRGAQRRLDRYLAARRVKGPPVPGPGARPGLWRRPAVTSEPPDPAGPLSRALPSPTAPAGVSALAADQVVNDRTTDVATGSGQAEVSVGASGRNLVAAWNDGEGFASGLSTQGYGYSIDNGASWTDGGIPPVAGGVSEWASDPVIAVNERTGAFYYAALCNPTSSTNGIAVVKGTFQGGTFTWGLPRVAVSGSNSSVIYDKQWLAVDSLTGNLYLTYARFSVSGGRLVSNEIQLSRNTSDNASAWSTPLKLSSPADNGRVQGSRVAAGPGGEVYATWHAIGPIDSELDSLRFRRSTDGGVTWASEVTAASLYTNFGTGAPGFNRGTGFAFPGLAVDRGPGPRRGRIYVAWNESVNFYDDLLGFRATINEAEPNDTPATGTPFTLGDELVGAIGSSNDFDYWRFSGVQGQTIICYLDTVLTATLDASFRLFCTDGTTRLAFSQTGSGGGDFATALLVFTLPATGTYTLRVAAFSGTGGYRIQTGTNGVRTERARDHRDVFVAYSDGGGSWSVPARVNGSAPYLDDWLPEVAVARDGDVYVLWYDWRDAPAGLCAGASMTYLARSTDGGASWPAGAPVSSALTHWTTAFSNIVPNQGDYNALFANQYGVYAAWGDGRNGDPDVFLSVVDLACPPLSVAVGGVEATSRRVRITWLLGESANLSANVYRRTLPGGSYTALAEISTGGTGRVVFEDAAVASGDSLEYRLGVLEPCGETFAGEVTVEVPFDLAIHAVFPNPADREILVSYTLARAAPATLELIDIAGRRVRTLRLGGKDPSPLDLSLGQTVPAGVYLVRLVQGEAEVVRRVSVVR